jgi:hypothetical protein
LCESIKTWGSAGLPQDLKIPDWSCNFGQVQAPDYVQLFFSFKWLNKYEFWSRAWIIQEITHSNAVFILGPYKATYEHLGQIWLQFMVQHYPLYDVEAGENPADCAMAIGSHISTTMLASIPTVGPDGRLDLDSWLNSFILMHEPRCLDPHDTIYAFYSLFTGDPGQDIDWLHHAHC